MLRDHLEKLYYFKIAADSGSFHKASSILGITQSSLSSSIKVLEDSIGSSLFYRTRQGVMLNKHGHSLYTYYSRLLQELGNFEENFNYELEKGRRTLRIGFYDSIAHYCGPQFLKLLREEMPDADIELTTGRSGTLLENVKERNIDIAISVEPHSDDLLWSQYLFSDSLSFFVKQKSTQHLTLSKFQFYEIPLILFSEAVLREKTTLGDLMHSLGVNHSRTICVNSFETALEMTIAGLGASLLPIRVAENRIHQLSASAQISEIILDGVAVSELTSHKIVATCLRENIKRREILQAREVLSRVVPKEIRAE